MEDHKQAKHDAKRTDLEYYEIIRRQKEEQVIEEKEKRDQIKRLVQEQKLVRDKQIEEHNLMKHLERNQKREDNERLKQIEQEVMMQKMLDKQKMREKKEKTLNVYQD